MLATDIPTILLTLAQALFVVAAIIFAISALDDLLIDVYFYARVLVKRLARMGKYKPLSIDDLTRSEEKPFALMLPAWKEADVLYSAVRNLISTIDYKNYQIFIGTYPNDADTQREAARLQQEFPHVHQVITRLPGPTCKADCLNQIIQAIFAYEYRNNMQFAGVVMQDAEDVVHPLSFRLYNHLVPRFDLVQIPVYSLKRKWYEITGGHYMDEFAEFHSKEILVREQFAGVVPGAGVGTVYSRRAINFAGSLGEYFSTHSLTEDYEFSFRLREAGLKMIFARVPLKRTTYVKDRHGRERKREVTDFIATREYFPNKFWASVRQKTRWTIGISFQGWRSFGWKGNWRIKYLFWRDRKMIFFSHAIALGIISLIIHLGYAAYQAIDSDGYQLAPLLEDGHPLWHLVDFNVAVMLYRIAQRHFWTWLYYGWSTLPMVTVRYVWGGVINYLAITRATRIFLNHLRTKAPIGWDKTSHDFPEDMDAVAFRQKLGDMLVERGLISAAELEDALREQATSKLPLGHLLVSRGVLPAQTLEEILEIQSGVRVFARQAAAGQADLTPMPETPGEPLMGERRTGVRSVFDELLIRYLLRTHHLDAGRLRQLFAQNRGAEDSLTNLLVEQGFISRLALDFLTRTVEDQFKHLHASHVQQGA